MLLKTEMYSRGSFRAFKNCVYPEMYSRGVIPSLVEESCLLFGRGSYLILLSGDFI